MRKTEIDYNKVYYNKQNKAFKVIKEVEPRPDINGQLRRRIRVKFIESGYETEVHLSILNHRIISLTDYLSPTVCGVGILGYTGARANFNMYKRWCDMIYRCYDPNNKNYSSYGTKGVYVCDRWLRFDYYLEDVVKLPGYNDMINNPDIDYNLDKDILQQGCECKVYGPDTCIWVPDTINSIQKAIDNKSNCNRKYYGVQLVSGNYRVSISDNGKSIYFGTYTNEIAAANAYNYYAQLMGRPTLNDVPYMSHQEFSSYLTRSLEMVANKNKFHGVQQLPYGNYRVVFYNNGDRTSLGTYTDKIAAANIYNYYCFANDRPMLNKVPYMSPQECAKYLVKPRVMCTIVDKSKQ